MNARNDCGCLAGIFINFLSIASAINNSFVRSEKINDLFCFDNAKCHNGHENKIFNLVFSLFNMLAVTPEVIHNVKMNARFYGICSKITGVDYGAQSTEHRAQSAVHKT